MSRELEVAKEIVESFWAHKLKETDNKEVIVELYRVKHAKPEELTHDFEALNAILERALKELTGTDTEKSSATGSKTEHVGDTNDTNKEQE